MTTGNLAPTNHFEVLVSPRRDCFGLCGHCGVYGQFIQVAAAESALPRRALLDVS